MDTEKIDLLEELVVRHLKDSKSVAHDFSHLFRVRKIAKYLANKEGANTEVAEAAALTHDIERREDSESDRYFNKSAEQAQKLLLEVGYPKDFIEKVVSCVESHSRSSSVVPETIEAKVVFDADKLDGLGYVGIVRWYLAMGHMGFDVEDSTKRYIYTLTESYKKLGGHLFTKTGSAMAENRFKLSREFANNVLMNLDRFE